MSILDEIVSLKKSEILALKSDGGGERIRRAAASAAECAPCHGFERALRSPGIRVVAEIKRASPSKGDIAPHLDPAALAREYERDGAAAISVLTERNFFKGSLEDFAAARGSVPTLPLLRKDFIIDPIQIHESRACGADAVLLIVRILDDSRLAESYALARELGMDALVEVYDESDARRAVALGATLVGINNRDLASFSVDNDNAGRIARIFPPGVKTVALSGVRNPADVEAMMRGGIDTFLIGEALSKNPALLPEILRSAPSSDAIKICGITRQADASLCAALGFGMVGFVFHKGSPRHIAPAAAGELRTGAAGRVGVFVGAHIGEIRATVEEARLTAVQLHPAKGEISDTTISDDEISELIGRGIGVIKVFRDADAALDTAPGVRILLECSGGDLPGGNGKEWNWNKCGTGIPAFGIAGGLTPDNLIRAARESQAAWFDISSGVEISPGIKNHDKLRSIANICRH